MCSHLLVFLGGQRESRHQTITVGVFDISIRLRAVHSKRRAHCRNGALLIAALQFAFPHDNDAPASLLKQVHITCISRNIRLELGFPEFRARRRVRCVPTSFMSMPETTMDKDNGLVFGQDDIRPARQVPGVKPVAKPSGMQCTPNHQLRLGVLSADPRHHPRPGLAVDSIDHVRLPLAFSHGPGKQ
jgi:hypothetical protein